MELNDFLEMMKDRQTVKASSEAMMFCHKMTQRALKMTAEINNSYHSPEKIQELFSELTGGRCKRKTCSVSAFSC